MSGGREARAGRLGTHFIATISAIGAVLAGLVWDQRSTANAYYDSGRGTPDLIERLEARPGEIYWIGGGRQTWWWLHRPQWLAPIQGAGLVFSRELSMLYRERSQRAFDAGLAEPKVMEPLGPPREPSGREMTANGISAFCAVGDAPAWIIAPIDGTFHVPPGVTFTTWNAPIAQLQPVTHGKAWQSVSRFAVIPCG